MANNLTGKISQVLGAVVDVDAAGVRTAVADHAVIQQTTRIGSIEVDAGPVTRCGVGLPREEVDRVDRVAVRHQGARAGQGVVAVEVDETARFDGQRSPARTVTLPVR